jgi:hypothetical protein
MASREELELLCSRSLDGDLNDAERAQLESALADDGALREFLTSLREAHEALDELAGSHHLTSDFQQSVLHGAGARVVQGPFGERALWAAAAAVVLFFGAGIAVLAFHQGDRVDGPGISRHPPTPVPKAHVVAFSGADFELRDAGGAVTRNRRVDGQVAVPAVLTAPAGSHAVIQLGKGTAVVAAGASVRLSDTDADGVPDIEPVEGDLYLDSWARGRMSTRVKNISVSVNGGGMSLTRSGGGYVARPLYGDALVGGKAVQVGSCANIEGDGVEVEPCDGRAPEAWVIEGRADAIKNELRIALGDHFDAITPQQWERGDKLLKAVLARPADRAVIARWLELLLRHGFFDDATPQEVQAWTKIAEILTEGTTDADVPEQVQAWMNYVEAEIKKHPERVAEVRRRVREALERYNDHGQRPSKE